MKYLGIDYGSKNIGLAVSDERGVLAFSRGTIPNNEQVITYVAHLIQTEKIDHVVMGDTRANNGLPNNVTPAAEKFAEELMRATGLPVARISETWTSFEAARYAPDQHHDDAAAAAIILQRYIDMNSSSVLPEEEVE